MFLKIFMPVFYSLWCKMVLYRIQIEKPVHQPHHKTVDLQSVPPARCAEASLAQNCGNAHLVTGLT